MHNNWSKILFFRFTTGWTRGPLYTTFFTVMQKLGRFYKLSASKTLIVILTGFNLTQALLTNNLSKLILSDFPTIL